jgi:predicted permease
MWGVIRQNLSFGYRTLVKNPGFAVTAILTLALGIGATTAMFSVVYAVFEPMPYPKPDQLVMVWAKPPGGRNSVPAGDFFDWQRRTTSFQAMGAWGGGSFNISSGDRPEQVPGSRRTPGFFTMEGLPLLYGRDFLPEEADPGKEHVVILSHRLWQRQFAGNRDLVGRQIRMNGDAYTVVGILPPGMHDRFNSQLWVPLSYRPEEITHESNFVLVMGRLKDGVTIEQAQTDVAGIAAQLQQEFPKSNANRGASVEPLHLNFVTESTRRNLWLLLGAVGFLLLIGCVNVANLLLARGTSRQREVALRAALGASRSRLFGQFLTESFLLAVLGGALGILLTNLILQAMSAAMPPVGTMLPSEANIRLSVPVLLFTIGVTMLAGLLFGTVPAWQATRLDLNEVMKLGGRTGAGGTRRKALRLLIVAEFALALTLLASGGLAFKGFWNLTSIDLGIRTDHLLTFSLPVPERRLKEPDQIRSYYGSMVERIEALPGVVNVAVTTGIPARGPGGASRFNLVGHEANPGQRRSAGLRMVTPSYYDTLGIQLTQGRRFEDSDTAGSQRVAMVNEQFVKQYLNGADPLTQRISMNEFIPGKPRGQPVEWQIVGVVRNTHGAGDSEDVPEINLPFAQSPWIQAAMAIRTEGDPKAMLNSIAAAVNSVDPDLPLAGAQTIDEIVSDSLAIPRFSVVLFAAFGLLGVLLAAVGIYGVMAFGVAQRTHEFGIRMALGAHRSGVMKMVLKEGTILAAVGSAIGLGGAYLVGRAMQSTLFGVEAFDVTAFTGVLLLLLLVAWLACLIPAWRASRVEPMVALRDE